MTSGTLSRLLGNAAISKCVSLLFARGWHCGSEWAIRWTLPSISSIVLSYSLQYSIVLYSIRLRLKLHRFNLLLICCITRCRVTTETTANRTSGVWTLGILSSIPNLPKLKRLTVPPLEHGVGLLGVNRCTEIVGQTLQIELELIELAVSGQNGDTKTATIPNGDRKVWSKRWQRTKDSQMLQGRFLIISSQQSTTALQFSWVYCWTEASRLQRNSVKPRPRCIKAATWNGCVDFFHATLC